MRVCTPAKGPGERGRACAPSVVGEAMYIVAQPASQTEGT